MNENLFISIEGGLPMSFEFFVPLAAILAGLLLLKGMFGRK